MICTFLCICLLGVPRSDDFEMLVNRGLEHSYNEEYDRASACFDSAITLEPDNPLGYFVYAGLYRIYASDFVTDSLLDSFFVYAERTTERAKRMLEQDPGNSWAYYFLGGISMYTSSVYIERGDYLRALGYAEQSMEDITRCLEIDKELFDAYLVLGSYEYLKGSFPLWGAYKDRGIEKVGIAAEKGRYARPIARNILSLLLQREKRYDEAIREAEALVSAYPESRTFLWTLSKAYIAKEDWDNAAAGYQKLLEDIVEKQPENQYNIVQAKLALATAHFHRGDSAQAILLCNDVVERGEGRREMKHMVKDARELLKRAQGRQ